VRAIVIRCYLTLEYRTNPFPFPWVPVGDRFRGEARVEGGAVYVELDGGVRQVSFTVPLESPGPWRMSLFREENDELLFWGPEFMVSISDTYTVTLPPDGKTWELTQ
jgi:hypothetical protein